VVDNQATHEFDVVISRPGRYAGESRLAISPESATLSAREVRFGNALAAVPWALFGVTLLASTIAVTVFGFADAGVSARSVTLAAFISLLPALIAVWLCSVLVRMLQRGLRGDVRDMTCPLAEIVPGMANGGIVRSLELKASFDPQHPAQEQWRISARTTADWTAIRSALGAGEKTDHTKETVAYRLGRAIGATGRKAGRR
jgi:hypothetical protein